MSQLLPEVKSANPRALDYGSGVVKTHRCGAVAATTREQFLRSPGERIAVARKTAGLTQDQLAKKVGVTKSAVSQWEQGRIKSLGGNTLYKLCDALQVNGRWIVLGDRPPGIPMYLSPEENDLIEAFRSLPEAAREELVSKAHEYQRITAAVGQTPSRSNPYPHRKK